MTSQWSDHRDASPEASRRLIELAREEFVAGNVEDRHMQWVRPLVRESWERAVKQHVVADTPPPIALAGDELDEYRRDHPLASAMEMIRALLLPGDSVESGVIVAVGDHAGRLLWVEGDRHIRDRTDDMGFVPGANWAEEAIGTTAPGTALAIGKSLQIHQTEHFSSLAHPWSCTAAPVLDPETRRILGVIDVTGLPDLATSQARMLVDATARAVESEMLVARLRARSEERPTAPVRRRSVCSRAILRVLGRDRARLEVMGAESESVIELSGRHAEILLLLAVHRQGLSADRLSELVYGEERSADTLRPEMVRLRRALQVVAPELVPQSRPYRLAIPLETDAQNVLALIDRGAHRVALTAYRGPVLPDSAAPGVAEVRETVRGALRDAMLTEASVDVLMAYAEIPEGAEDVAVLRLCLELLPARSPRRANLVSRIERLEHALRNPEHALRNPEHA